MAVAIAELQQPFLDAGQIASSRAIVGLDTEFIDDGTCFVVAANGVLAGCGGWSRHAMRRQPPGCTTATSFPAVMRDIAVHRGRTGGPLRGMVQIAKAVLRVVVSLIRLFRKLATGVIAATTEGWLERPERMRFVPLRQRGDRRYG